MGVYAPALISLASVSSSTSQGTISTTNVILTGLTSTVTIPAGGRRVQIELLVPDMSSTSVCTFTLSIYNTATVTGSPVQSAKYLQGVAGAHNSGYMFWEHTPAAGSQSYCAAISCDSGTGSTVLSSTQLAYLSIRLM